MRRGRKRNPRQYVEMRIKQLIEEGHRASDQMTRRWLWKCADELKWVKQVIDEERKENK